MDIAIERCQELSGKDLPSNLKITSISSRLKNLQHLGGQLYLSLANKPSPTTSKGKRRSHVITRSASTSASEVSIREQLAALQAQFSHYKEEFEIRRLSQEGSLEQRPQARVSPVSPILMETRAALRSSVQANGHAPKKARPMSSDHLGVERESFNKTASLGRRSTIGVWWAGKIKDTSGSNAVKEKIAVLNEKSKEDIVPIQELGTSFGQSRQRAKSAGSATIRQILQGGEDEERKVAAKPPAKAPQAGEEESVVMKKPRVVANSQGGWEVDDESAAMLLRRRAKAAAKAEGVKVVLKSDSANVEADSAKVEAKSEGAKVEAKSEGAKVEAKSEGAKVEAKSESTKVTTREGGAESGVVLRRRAETDTIPHRRGRGLSKAERSQRIEDIKKLFETSEIADHLGNTGNADSAPSWSPREYDIRTPSSSDVGVVGREPGATPGRTMSVPNNMTTPAGPAITVSPPPTPPAAVTTPHATPTTITAASQTTPLAARKDHAVPRERINTAPTSTPTIIRTVIKDNAPPTRQQVITISIDSTPSSKDAVSAEPETQPAQAEAHSLHSKPAEDSSLNSRLIKPPQDTSLDSKPVDESSLKSRLIKPPKDTSLDSKPVDESSLKSRLIKPPKDTSLDSKPVDESSLKSRLIKPPKDTSLDSKPVGDSSLKSRLIKPPQDTSLDSKPVGDSSLKSRLIKPPQDTSLDSKSIEPAEESVLDSKPVPPANRAARSVSPTSRHRVNSVPTSPASPISSLFRKGNGRGLIKGKVSSLRDMFDSNSKPPADPGLVVPKLAASTTDQHLTADTDTMPEVTPKEATPTNTAIPTNTEATPTNTEATPHNKEPLPPVQAAPVKDTSDSEIIPAEEATPTNKEATPILDSVVSVTVDRPSSSQEVEQLAHGGGFARHLKEPSPARPCLPSPAVSSPHYTPPPRPPPPLGYYDHSNSNTPNPEWDSESSAASESGSSLLDDADMEWIEDEIVEWDEDEVDSAADIPDSPHARVSRPLKSMRAVLSDLLTSELEYLQSLELLSKVYLPHSQTSTHTPSFLRGAETKIFSHLIDLYTFQR